MPKLRSADKRTWVNIFLTLKPGASEWIPGMITVCLSPAREWHQCVPVHSYEELRSNPQQAVEARPDSQCLVDLVGTAGLGPEPSVKKWPLLQLGPNVGASCLSGSRTPCGSVRTIKACRSKKELSSSSFRISFLFQKRNFFLSFSQTTPSHSTKQTRQ